MRGLNMSRTVASTCSLTGRGSGGSGFEPCDASGARRREKRKRPSTPEQARMMKRTDLKPFQPTETPADSSEIRAELCWGTGGREGRGVTDDPLEVEHGVVVGGVGDMRPGLGIGAQTHPVVRVGDS